jgi:pyridoxine kinase
MARILAISSLVTRGHVGLAATAPALQHLGHEVWTLPTVLLASRPGLGRLVKRDVPAPDLAAMLSALAADGCWETLDAVFTGYFVTPDAVLAAAQAIGGVRQANLGAVVCVDPVLGDAGRLYVAEATAAAIRDTLLPLATVATPNLFELAWLTGAPLQTLDDIANAARRLGPPTVIVTSAAESDTQVTTLLVSGEQRIERSSPKRASIPNGAGDLFAGLLLGHLLDAKALVAALDLALADLDRVLAASTGSDVLRLSAL